VNGFFFENLLYFLYLYKLGVFFHSDEIVDGLLENVLLNCRSSSSRTGHCLCGRGGAREIVILGLGRRKHFLFGFACNAKSRLTMATIKHHNNKCNESHEHDTCCHNNADKSTESKTSVQLWLVWRSARIPCAVFFFLKKTISGQIRKWKNITRCPRCGSVDRIFVRLHTVQRSTCAKINARSAVRVNGFECSVVANDRLILRCQRTTWRHSKGSNLSHKTTIGVLKASHAHVCLACRKCPQGSCRAWAARRSTRGACALVLNTGTPVKKGLTRSEWKKKQQRAIGAKRIKLETKDKGKNKVRGSCCFQKTRQKSISS
jgi:hypothetical protein